MGGKTQMFCILQTFTTVHACIHINVQNSYYTSSYPFRCPEYLLCRLNKRTRTSTTYDRQNEHESKSYCVLNSLYFFPFSS